MELKNLNVLKSETESKYKNSSSFGERRLPKSFKELITQFDNDRITYNEFSFIVQRTSDGIIVAPNQWLYIAAFYSSYYKELLAYKDELYNHLLPRYDNKKNALEEPIKACFDNIEKAKSLLDHYPNGQNKDYLIRFLSDYKWWGGAKTIDRSDFCASAILSSAGLVNAAQGYVTDICKFLAKNPEAENILLRASISEGDDSTSIIKNELLRYLSAATFLRKALKIIVEEDANLSRLEALNQYKKTNKQLKINGFNLWRRKDELPLRSDDVCKDIEIEYNGQTYVMYLEWTPADMERMFFPVFNKAYEGLFKMEKDGKEYVLYKLSQLRKSGKVDGPLQQIFYGAPGTGKSFKIKKDVEDAERIYFRTTFHPDSDYSTFVGCYKPTMDKSAGNSSYEGITRDGEFEEPNTKGNIIYTFTPQAFTNAYIKAWQTKEPVFLIIEEINRGNCAQIFGDLFQLLDRDENGYSQYKVDADTDLADHIRTELKKKCRDDAPEYIYSEEELKLQLPSNLYIWATMNTSDQSLFPIDSAFKRRWEWVYSPIAEGKEKDGSKAFWEIEGQGEDSWWKFIQGINEVIDVTAHSEDKKLGFYFCKPTKKVNESDKYSTIITKNTFVNKVVFYLWNDVFKVYGFKSEIFDLKDENGTSKKITFKSFYKENGSVNDETVKVFVNNVMAKAPKSKDTENEEQNGIESESEA